MWKKQKWKINIFRDSQTWSKYVSSDSSQFEDFVRVYLLQFRILNSIILVHADYKMQVKTKRWGIARATVVYVQSNILRVKALRLKSYEFMY